MNTEINIRKVARHRIEAKRYTGERLGIHWDSTSSMSCGDTMRNIAFLLNKHVPRIEAEYAAIATPCREGAMRYKRQRLDSEFVRLILAELQKGYKTQTRIAKEFQVCQQTVSMIKHKNGPYKYLNDEKPVRGSGRDAQGKEGQACSTATI